MNKKDKEIKKLKEKIFFLEEIIANIPGHVFWLDKDNRFLGCNNLQAKDAGLERRHEIIGKTNYDMPWKEQANALNRLNNEVMKTKKTIAAEEPSIMANGKMVVFHSEKTPLLNSKGEVVGTLGVAVDITERKRILSELAAVKAQLNLLSLINHESRRPMQVVLGVSQILKDKKINDFKDKKDCYDTYHEGMKDIFTYGTKLMDIINYLYDFVEQEVYDKELPTEEIDLKSLMDWFPKEYSHILTNKHVNFKTVYSDEIPRKIIVNSRRLHNVLDALVKNAIIYTENGYITVDISGKHVKNKEYILTIKVKDTGNGINKEQLPHIFNHFDYEKDKSYMNSGLTLSVNKKRIEMLGGNMGIKSEIGVGTEVWFNLPVKLPADKKEIITKDIAPHVLVIEDNEVCAFINKELLASIGCTADIAANGKEAKKLLKQNKYNLVLLDILLPDAYGYELIPFIHKTNGTIPIIAVTAQITEIDKEKCLDAGVEDIIYKPVFKDELNHLVNKYVHQKGGKF